MAQSEKYTRRWPKIRGPWNLGALWCRIARTGPWTACRVCSHCVCIILILHFETIKSTICRKKGKSDHKSITRGRITHLNPLWCIKPKRQTPNSKQLINSRNDGRIVFFNHAEELHVNSLRTRKIQHQRKAHTIQATQPKLNKIKLKTTLGPLTKSRRSATGRQTNKLD